MSAIYSKLYPIEQKMYVCVAYIIHYIIKFIMHNVCIQSLRADCVYISQTFMLPRLRVILGVFSRGNNCS